MKRLACAALCLLELTISANGQMVNRKPANRQIVNGKLQPDRIDVGTVYIGATVEASFMIQEAGMDTNVKFDVQAPSFVKILNKNTQLFDKPAANVRGSVEFAIDTSRAGKLQAVIKVQLGRQSATLPVAALVKQPRSGLLRLLVVGTPFSKFFADDGGMSRIWTDLVAVSPWNVSYLLAGRGKPILRDLDLSMFDAILVNDTEGMAHVSASDRKRLRVFAESGGWVYLVANHFHTGTVLQAQAILKGYGLEMQDGEASIDANQITVDKTGLDPQIVKAGIEQVSFFRASPLTVTDETRAKFLVQVNNPAYLNGGHIAVANAGTGRFIAIGQPLPWFWISKLQDKTGGNVRLFQWLLNQAYLRRLRMAALTQPLSEAQLADYWRTLATDDLDDASDAAEALTRAPESNRRTVAWLRQRLKPDAPPDAKRLRTLIADLTTDSPKTRHDAQRELERMGDRALAPIRKELASSPPAEARRRLESIVRLPQAISPDMKRALRAIDILQRLPTPEAEELLLSLSKGAPQTRVTNAAIFALERSRAATEEKHDVKPDLRK